LRNTWRDYLRSNAARAQAGLEELSEEPEASQGGEPEVGGDPEAILETFSDEQVIDALQALPEEIRWTLLLVDVEGLTVQEAAAPLFVAAPPRRRRQLPPDRCNHGSDRAQRLQRPGTGRGGRDGASPSGNHLRPDSGHAGGFD